MLLIRLALLLLTILSPTASLLSQSKINFEQKIFPIFEKNCIECHRETYVDKNGRKRRPKGRVMLDTLANIQKSKRGRLMVAGKPEDSLLLDSILLPADDEDRMPPPKKGPPLKKAQVELIERWIQQGANYGKWTGEKKGSTRKPSKPKTTRPKSTRTGSKRKGPAPSVTLSKGLSPVPAKVLATFADSLFQVRSIGDDNPLLYVSCCGKTDDVDDAALEALRPIAEHIFELDLARSQVGDPGCAEIAKMPRLTKLDLRQTKVGNAAAKELANCRELRSLNLFGTATGDYALTAFAALKKLERLYLFETEASAKAVIRLREAIPGIRIVTSLELPEPMEETPGNGRRRR